MRQTGSIARERGALLEFYMNINRNEGDGPIVNAVQGFFSGLRWAELREVPWCSWPAFWRVVAGMAPALQVSMTESFNLTTANAAAEAVQAVVTDSIEWVPDPGRLAPTTSRHRAGRLVPAV